MKIRVSEKISDKVFFESENIKIEPEFFKEFCRELGLEGVGVFLTTICVSEWRHIDSFKDLARYFKEGEEVILNYIELLLEKEYIEIVCEE